VAERIFGATALRLLQKKSLVKKAALAAFFVLMAGGNC
jgi:hypothetical protein